MPRRVKPHASKLVKVLLDNPQLPAYVAQMDAPVLNNLIQHVGKEDAQELIELATPDQVRELIALDVWEADGPGAAEVLNPTRVLEWLEIWRDMKPAFLVQKLHELGSDLLSATLMEYVVVVDMTQVGVDGDVSIFGEFGVIPQEEEDWPPLSSLLTDIWSEDPELLMDVLGRCCLRRSLRSDTAALSDQDLNVREDLAGEHEDAQMARGYVGPLQAALMLGDAKDRSLDELMIEVVYDQLSALHLTRVQEQRRQAQSRRSTSNEPDEATDEVRNANDGHGDNADAASDFSAIHELLTDADILSTNSVQGLLTAPTQEGRDYLSECLIELGQTDTQALADRQDELVYLANILIGGTSVQGQAFSRADAALAASALCNLGLTYCVYVDPWDSPEVVTAEFLKQPPGLCKAFRIGYHLLSHLSERAAAGLNQALTSDRAGRRWQAHPWLAQRVQNVLQQTGNSEQSWSDHLDALPKLLESLGMVFDSSTCHCLRVLCDPFPCFPNALKPGEHIHLDTSTRFIKDADDMARIDAFLDSFEL